MIRSFVISFALIMFCFGWLIATAGPIVVAITLFGDWGLISLPFAIALSVALMEWFVNGGGEQIVAGFGADG